MYVLLLTGLMALADPAPPSPTLTLALTIQPAVGITDEELPVFTKRIADEAAGAGFVIVTAEPMDATCGADGACVESTRLAMPGAPAGLLVIELIRVGPVVQLSATGAAGPMQVSASHGLDETQLAGGKLMPRDVQTWLGNVAAAGSPKPKVDEPPPPEPTGTSFELTPLRSGALFIGGVGAIALVAGVIAIAAQEAVLSDAKSTGDQKESAHVLEWVGVIGAALGLAAAAGGATLFALE